jgi:hypothetical protein
MNKLTRLLLGAIVSVIIIAGIGQFIYIDSCLDMGGIIIDGICYNEYYEALQYAISVPMILVAISMFLSLAVAVSFFLDKVFCRLK